MPTSHRPFSSKWWPDQLVGAIILLNFTLALRAGDVAISGTGIGLVVSHTMAMLWFGILAGCGLWIVVSTERDEPRCTAVALAVAGALLAVNGVITVQSKGDGALAASTAYIVATIGLWERARLAWLLARVRAGVREIGAP